MAVKHRSVVEGTSAIVAVAALVGGAILVNAIADRHFKRWDWTGARMYSLSDKTVKLLQNLETDVEATVLIQPVAESYDEVRELLNNYRAKSSRFKVEFLDPAKEKARVEQLLMKFGIDPRGDRTAVVFSSGDRHKHVAVDELAEYDMSAAAMGGGGPKMKAFRGEVAFTSAILSVTEDRQRTVCFLKGHNEVPLDDAEASGARGFSQIKKELERENFRVDTTDVLGKSPLPKECDLLVIAGPTRGFAPPEAQALRGFIDGGGRLLALIDPPFSREGTLLSLGIEPVFEERGIAIGDDIALDPSQKLLFGTAESFAASDFPFHEITKDIKDTVVIFGLARSVVAIQPPPSGWTVSPLARTSENGWGERDLAHLDGVAKDATDLEGPVCVAVAAEKVLDGGKSTRVVVFGDSDFAHNQFVGAYANLDLFLNSVHWLTGGSEQIGISPREPEQVHLVLTGRQEAWIMATSLLIMPGLAVAGGVALWLIRRR